MHSIYIPDCGSSKLIPTQKIIPCILFIFKTGLLYVSFIFSLHGDKSKIALNLLKYHYTPIRKAIIKKSHNNNCWQECGEIRTLIYPASENVK